MGSIFRFEMELIFIFRNDEQNLKAIFMFNHFIDYGIVFLKSICK